MIPIMIPTMMIINVELANRKATIRDILIFALINFVISLEGAAINA